MKTAIVYDYMPALGGGAERNLIELIDHFAPDVEIFFGFVVDSPYSREYLRNLREKYSADHIHTGATIKSFKPISFRILNYMLPSLLQSFKLDRFDLVVSYTAFLSHSIIPPIKGKHILYTNTPARFLWNLTHAQSLMKQLFSPVLITNFMQFLYRLYDLDAVEATKTIVTISKSTQERVRTYYDRDSSILYPASFPEALLDTDYGDQALKDYLGEYLIHISRIESYKNIQLLIDLVTSYDITQKIIILGDGPYKKKLMREFAQRTGKNPQSMTIDNNPATQIGNVIFTGYVPEEEKFRLLTNASAFLALNDEDFGISKVESLAVGTPVIGLSAGATPEFIHHGHNGLLFEEATAESLYSVLQLHNKLSYDREMVRKTAKPFSNEAFHTNLDALLNA